MKHTGKRLLALLLVLIFCVSLLPTAAVAEPAGERETRAAEGGGPYEENTEAPGEDNPAPAPAEEPADGDGDDDTSSGADAPPSPQGEGAEDGDPDDPDDPAGDGVLDVPSDDPDALPSEDEEDLPEGVTATGSCGDDVSWSLSDTGVLTISGSGAMWSFSSSDKPSFFDYHDDIVSVEIQSGVTSIGRYLFYGLSASSPRYPNLVSVTIPSTVTEIGANAFYCCPALTTAELPSGLTTLGMSSFLATALTEVTIPAGVTEIPTNAFRDCASLRSLTIGSNVATIGSYAFANDTALAEISFLGSAPTSIHVYAFSGVNATAYYPSWNTTWTEDVMQDYGGAITWVGYDDKCGDAVYWHLENGVLTIYGSGPMWDYDMNKHPGYYASRGSITSVVIENGVTSIGRAAFLSCEQLTSIEIPGDVTSIRYDAFYNCSSLTEIEIPASVTEIEDVPFLGCTSLTAINVDPANPAYQSKEGVLFSKDGTILLECPGGKAGAYAIPGSVVSIGAEAFYQCVKLTNVVIPDGVTGIGTDAFNSCTLLTRVTIPEGVTSIPVRMLANCPALESITIPSGVTSVGMYAFASCTALAEITFQGSAPTINNYAFEGVTATAYYPSWNTTWTENVKQDYGGRITWVGFDAKCGEGVYWHLENGVLTIYGEGPMWDFGSELPGYYESRESITSVVIEEGVTRIGNVAFYECTLLAGITIPDSVTEIGGAAFAYCQSLTDVTIPDSVTTIEIRAFYYCSSLTGITIPAGVTDMGEYVFQYCGSLTEINVDPANPTYRSEDGVLFTKDGRVLLECPEGKTGAYAVPDGVVIINDRAFYQCAKLTSVTIPEGVTQIRDGAFYSCTMLESVTIPEGVTSIPVDAFARCTSLERVTIPSSVTSFGYSAFSNCSSLTVIGFTGSAPTIADDAFRNVTATAYYPAGDETWTEAVMQDYGGAITWVGYDGQCGDTAFWRLTDGVMIIFGSGPMWDYYSDYPDYHAYEETITSVVIKNGVTHIGNFAFVRCEHFTGIMIPSSVTSIGDNAFSYCEALTDVTISSSVTEIGSSAFLYCGSLTAINVDPANPAYQSKDGVLLSKDGMTLLTYPGGKAGAYAIPDGVSYIEEHAFIRCSQLTSVTFPEGVSIIMKYAFTDCSSLTSVTLPESMAGIWEGAFERCTSLENVTIPAGVTFIGSFAFGSCTSLTEITFTGNAPSIQNFAFHNVTATAYYPAGDETWTEDVMQDYHGHITWVSYAPAPSYLPGDINGDGEVNNKDVMRLLRYVKGNSVSVVEAALDVNGDGTVNNKDVMRLLRYVKGNNVEIY